MSTNQGMLTFDQEVGRKLDILYRTPDLVARRSAILRAVQPKPGEYGLDIGPGPGFLACELAERVGQTGQVTAIEKSPAMLAMTLDRANRLGVAGWLTAHEGDAASLPFPDESFDFVVAAQVYEYVPAIQQALAEAYRVLRPGGRLVIVDTDWDTLAIQVDDRELARRVYQAWDAHLAHVSLPPQLPCLLRRADFHIAAVELVPILNLAYDPSTYGFSAIDLMANFTRGQDSITAADVDAWLADIEQQSSNGCYFFSLNQYLFHAIKPDAESGI